MSSSNFYESEEFMNYSEDTKECMKKLEENLLCELDYFKESYMCPNGVEHFKECQALYLKMIENGMIKRV